MKLLFLTHYFPPESNAPARRSFEHIIEWIKERCDVTVITNNPNHPNGVLHNGYKNKLYKREFKDKIKTIRVWTFITKNSGFLKRSFNFIVYLFNSVIIGLFQKCDYVFATSPQFFCGLSGMVLSKLKRKPFILEIRDLWPESIKTVTGTDDSLMIKVLSYLEKKLYNSANLIVINSPSFRSHIEALLKRPIKIIYIPNGIHMRLWEEKKRSVSVSPVKELSNKEFFHVGYVGTLGMAHGLKTVIDCAILMKDQPVMFHLIGSGAEHDKINTFIKDSELNNVKCHGLIDNNAIPLVLSELNCLLVMFIKKPLFDTVIPSKIYEAMVSGKPIIGAVGKQAKQLIEETQSGICVEQENEFALKDGIDLLMNDSALVKKYSQSGKTFIKNYYSREVLALDMLNKIKSHFK